jgi:hypothetical protein
MCTPGCLNDPVLNHWKVTRCKEDPASIAWSTRASQQKIIEFHCSHDVQAGLKRDAYSDRAVAGLKQFIPLLYTNFLLHHTNCICDHEHGQGFRSDS